MSTDTIRKAISELRQEDDELAELELKTARRRAQIASALSSLLALESEEPVNFPGTLADACRRALTESSVPLTVPDVRDSIRVLGYDISKHTNILASIHNALKRFEQAGHVERDERDGQTTYLWKGRVAIRGLAGLGETITAAGVGLTEMIVKGLGAPGTGIVKGLSDEPSFIQSYREVTRLHDAAKKNSDVMKASYEAMFPKVFAEGRALQANMDAQETKAKAFRDAVQKQKTAMRAIESVIAPKPPTPIKTGSIRIPANRKSESED